MKEILLTTFNARYAHTSIAQRYLFANLEELQGRAKILEFVINSQVVDAAEEILSYQPKIVGIGAYILNALEVQSLSPFLKKLHRIFTSSLEGQKRAIFPIVWILVVQTTLSKARVTLPFMSSVKHS